MAINQTKMPILNKKITVRSMLHIFSNYYMENGSSNNRANSNDLLTYIEEAILNDENKTKTGYKKNILAVRTSDLPNKYKNYNEAIINFRNFYANKYAESTLFNHMTNLRLFMNFLIKKGFLFKTTLDSLSIITDSNLKAYENHIVNLMEQTSIQKCTVNKYLKSVELLFDFLRARSYSKLRYIVPLELHDQGNRSNEYASVEVISALLESLDQISIYKERDLTVLLLIMELGCRPIELASLTLNDIHLTEHKITLFCYKSGQRTLDISKDLKKVFEKYLEFRSKQNLQHDVAFINRFGEPTSSNGISTIIRRANLKTFGEIRATPKTLRHTYATNALDNYNDFDEVSRSMGHLHRVSTEYYVHKSVERLLKMALPHNPAKRINEINTGVE